ncbi:MAG: hypothetical protein ABMA25_26935, partial [Ilumatobacteraceae bacterium]
TRVVAIACRYLNSGYPVLIGTSDHAFALIGYSRRLRNGERDWIHFIRHDDQRGPYLVVENVLADTDPSTGNNYGPWTMLIAPVPEKLWLSPEAAERTGQRYMLAMSQEVERLGLISPRLALHHLDSKGHVAYRTYAISATSFKSTVLSRGLDESSAREYRLARLPRLVWVVEAVDRRRRKNGQPSVLAEAVFDSTSTDYDPEELIIRVPGACLVRQTDGAVRFPLPTPRRYSPSAASTQP